MATTLITGAAGNLGRRLAAHLMASGHGLRLMYHRRALPPSLAEAPGVTAVPADLARPETLRHAVEHADTIVHLAGVLFAPRPERFLRVTNTVWFENLLRVAIEARVRRIILISFPHVEGPTSVEEPATGRLDRSRTRHTRVRVEGPRYPVARACAPRLEERFARRAKDAAGGPSATPLPDARAIEALIDAAFWSSLLREEGYAPEISLAYLPPERADRALRLAVPLPLDSRALAKLAPAVQRPGIHLGVWRVGEPLVVWGTTRVVPTFSFVVEVLGPGLLVVKHRIREDSVKFENVAVFEGERVKILSRQPPVRCDPPALLCSFLAPDTASGTDSTSVLLRLAVSMRAHRRGGTLLVVPAGSEAWRQSIERPVRYQVEPAFTELGDAIRAAGEGGTHSHEDMTRVVDALAGLTAVDGATLMTDRYELLAFGVKIGRADDRTRVERVILSEPVEGDVASVVTPLELGGTRHLSAAQFVQDQRDAVALVASQDGRFTVFAWSPREDMVHAHRVETLLL